MADGTDMMGPGFAALPRSLTSTGAPRRVGVEIEFSGLEEGEVARIVTDVLGGSEEQAEDFRAKVVGTAVGDLDIVLDTALRKRATSNAAKHGLDAARAIVPVEIVTGPQPVDALGPLDDLCAALRQAGASGTGAGLLLGFGVHFNVETVTVDDPFTVRTILAYALLEDWLRARRPIDPSRRATPFVDPWPRAFVDALTDDADLDLPTIRRLYADHVASRNHGLDLLPLLKAADETKFADHFPGADTKGRPAFHFRLPDCRIDEADWRLSSEWISWWLVEALADRPDLLDTLAVDWRDRDAALIGDRAAWAKATEQRLGPDAEALRQ